MSSIKIYFGNTPLIITDENLVRSNNDLFTDNPSEVIPLMSKGGFAQLILTTDDLTDARGEVFKNFKLIKAGGGIVRNTSGEILLIYRKRHWDLPKGHLEDSESMKECALREVSEETGLKHLHIIHKSAITYHVYKEDSQDILKETHWFFMDNHKIESLHPQHEEDISNAEWVSFDDMEKYFNDMYPSIRDVLMPMKKHYLRS
jgi:8-oxo-dGTP pyrophosphatase MutT (NUDIX family)